MTVNAESMKIAVLDDYQGVALTMADWSPLRDRAIVTVFNDTIGDIDLLIERLTPFDVLCVMRERTPLSRVVIERLPRLKLIASTGPKNASIDGKAAEERGITVLNTRGSLVAPTELTWALILASARFVTSESDSLRAGGWQRSVGDELKGKTLGILGLGRIGVDIARIGRAFGMEIIAWDARLTREKADAADVRLVSKEELFGASDVLSIHLVLVEATRSLVGAAELALMKPTARLVNTSRGPIVDEAALVTALSERRLAGAALDVFDVEPLPAHHPFRTMENVLATPHLGYVSRDQYEVFYGDAVAGIAAWLDAQRASA